MSSMQEMDNGNPLISSLKFVQYSFPSKSTYKLVAYSFSNIC